MTWLEPAGGRAQGPTLGAGGKTTIVLVSLVILPGHSQPGHRRRLALRVELVRVRTSPHARASSGEPSHFYATHGTARVRVDDCNSTHTKRQSAHVFAPQECEAAVRVRHR